METRTCSGDVGAHTSWLRLERICRLKRAGDGHCPSLGSGRLGQLHRLRRVRELRILLKLLRHLLRELELKLLVLPLEQLELQKLLLQLVDALRDS